MTNNQAAEVARVRFDRIGRNHHVPDMPIVGDPGDGENVAGQVYSHAKGHLGSRFYETAVNEDTGEVLIEWGRFGRGQIVGHTYSPDVQAWCSEHMEPYCPRHTSPARTEAERG